MGYSYLTIYRPPPPPLRSGQTFFAYVSDDFNPKQKILSTKKLLSNLLFLQKKHGKFFFGFKSSEMYAKKLSSKSEQIKMYVKGLRPTKLPDSWGASPPHPLRGLRPQASVAFGCNSSNQHFIGYHWLPFLNQARKNL